MILLKFIFWLFVIYIAFYLFFRLFGKQLSRYLLRVIARKAQANMDRQSKIFQEQAEEHSPFEETVYRNKDVKVSVRRGQKEVKKHDPLAPSRIEDVEYEDVE